MSLFPHPSTTFEKQMRVSPTVGLSRANSSSASASHYVVSRSRFIFSDGLEIKGLGSGSSPAPATITIMFGPHVRMTIEGVPD